jgi:hypothetical protein
MRNLLGLRVVPGNDEYEDEGYTGYSDYSARAVNMRYLCVDSCVVIETARKNCTRERQMFMREARTASASVLQITVKIFTRKCSSAQSVGNSFQV